MLEGSVRIWAEASFIAAFRAGDAFASNVAPAVGGGLSVRFPRPPRLHPKLRRSRSWVSALFLLRNSVRASAALPLPEKRLRGLSYILQNHRPSFVRHGRLLGRS